MDKKNTRLIILVVVLSLLVVGLGGFIVHDKLFNDNNAVVDDNETDNDLKGNDENILEDNNEIDDDSINNDVATEVVDKRISYSGEYIDLSKYIEEFNSNENYKNKLFNLIINSIMINDKKYTFKFSKHPQNCLDNVLYYEEGHNEFYINDKKIYTQNNQACYLEMLQLITVIDEKYIGIGFRSQGGNYMKIYDADIELVDTLEFISVSVENGEVIYTDYQEGNGCLINYYLYSIIDGKPVKTFKEQVSNTTCNQMTGEGCCNY